MDRQSSAIETQPHARAAWNLQRQVNTWFLQNLLWAQLGADLTWLSERSTSPGLALLSSDPDANWYHNDGRRPNRRPHAGSLTQESFWRAVDPLYDLLHEHYGVAWTYSVLMLQPSAGFTGTERNLGIGEHFSGRAEVIFSDEPGSSVRPGWHANQLPAFLVQQSLANSPPFDLISTYALNVRFLTDALPFTITRSHREGFTGNRRRVVSVAPFYEALESEVGRLAALVDSTGKYYDRETGWGKGAIGPLHSLFTQLTRELSSILGSAKVQRTLKSNRGNLFTIVEGGLQPNLLVGLIERLGSPNGTHLALAKYLLLMEAVWPDWTSITMLPHPVPMLSDPQPGGIVICEDSRSRRLTTDDINMVGDLLSVAIWPWMTLQESSRRAGEAARGCALFGEVLRHDLSNTLTPVQSMLADKDYRTTVSDSKCDKYLADLKGLIWSIEGLCGLDDFWGNTVLFEAEKMFANLSEAFEGNPDAAFSLGFSVPGPHRIPRLYYAVFVELIRNAAKRKPISWKTPGSHIQVSIGKVGTSTTLVSVENACEGRHANTAQRRLSEAWLEFAEARRSRHVGSRRNRKGLGLVANLTRLVGDEVAASIRTDAQGHHWFIVSIRIVGRNAAS